MDVQDLLERTSRLPRGQRFAIVALVYVLVGAAFWLLLYSPQGDEIAKMETKRAELQARKEMVERRARDREAFEQELEDLTAQLREALRQLPDDREIPDLLSRISSIGRHIGLEIRKFLPKEEVIHEYHAEVPVQLELSGSYHEVAMFFDRLSKLSRIVYVQGVEMSNPSETSGKVLVNVQGTLTTFRFLGEEERKKAVEQKAERKSRRPPRAGQED